jgi:hypothetical protein
MGELTPLPIPEGHWDVASVDFIVELPESQGHDAIMVVDSVGKQVELEQYLRVFVSERRDNWMELLPLAEFQYNNHVHASTQHSPFLFNTGCHLQMGFEPNEAPSHMETVNKFWDRMASILEEAKLALAKAKNDMAQYYNRHHSLAPVYKVGDIMYLDSQDIHTIHPSQKLAHRYLGPYKVEKCVGTHAYHLKLPTAMSHLHPVFHVVKLLLAPRDPIPGR